MPTPIHVMRIRGIEILGELIVVDLSTNATLATFLQRPAEAQFVRPIPSKSIPFRRLEGNSVPSDQLSNKRRLSVE